VKLIIVLALLLSGSTCSRSKAKSPECLEVLQLQKQIAQSITEIELANTKLCDGIRAKQIELHNLELEDQISHLQGRPAKNLVKLARLDGEIESCLVRANLDPDRKATNGR
jgi:hypothetical protein